MNQQQPTSQPPQPPQNNAFPTEEEPQELQPAYPHDITRRDPVLGVVFTQRPTDFDDLKQIHGVARVLEGKLHAMGIYTYRQVLEWDDQAIDAVSKRIAFKDRVRRDHWVEQVRRLYRAKYGQLPRAA